MLAASRAAGPGIGVCIVYSARRMAKTIVKIGFVRRPIRITEALLPIIFRSYEGASVNMHFELGSRNNNSATQCLHEVLSHHGIENIAAIATVTVQAPPNKRFSIRIEYRRTHIHLDQPMGT